MEKRSVIWNGKNAAAVLRKNTGKRGYAEKRGGIMCKLLRGGRLALILETEKPWQASVKKKKQEEN